jgi:hypothetical protein
MNPCILPEGALALGANYWASHAGTRMWTDWREEVVRADFEQLAGAGLTWLRIFPLWPAFQPIERLAGGAGRPFEMRFGEAPLPDTPAGQDGVDAVMLARLQALCDQAHKHGLRLIVGLVTGWMSGRLFVPPALANRDVLTDPESIRWQVRLVRRLVTELRGHPAVAAWDLGNECNCMGRADLHQAYVWTQAIAGAIRGADATRPVVSGMHSLPVDHFAGAWSIRDQAELTDILTTHPYPLFTPLVDLDPVTSLRPASHAACETRLYADLGGQPCFAEETGTLGTMTVCDALAPHFLRTVLWSLWANDGRGMLWWCAYDQNHLLHAPYDWTSVERELGLFRADRAAKPLVAEFAALRAIQRAAGVEVLPPRLVEAVCVLTRDQESWPVAFNAWCLAKQAGFDLLFRTADQELPASGVYLLPSLKGGKAISRQRWHALLARVEAGATLYVSLDDWWGSEIESVFGVENEERDKPGPRAWRLDGSDGEQRTGPVRWRLRPTRAQVLGREADGNPIFTVVARGRGRIFLCTAPLEMEAARTPGAHAHGASGWRVYARVLAGLARSRVAAKALPGTALTEHPVDGSRRLLVAINHRQEAVAERLVLAPGWRLEGILHGQGHAEGDAVVLDLPRNAAALVAIAGA